MAAKRSSLKKNSPDQTFDKVGENLYRHRTSKTYYALLKRGGKQFRRSLKTTDRALAARRLADLRRLVGNLSVSDDSHTDFAEIAKNWLQTVRHTLKPASILRRETCIKNLRPFFKGQTIRNVKPSHCDTWLQGRGRDIAPSTFAHELGTMKLIFNFAVERGLLLDSPAKHIKRKPFERTEIHVPSRDQFQKLIAAMRDAAATQGKGRDAANFVELLAYSGCRQAEANSLRWLHVNFESETITVNGTKTDSSKRTIPMTSALRNLLDRMKDNGQPQPTDLIAAIKDAKTCLHSTCRKLGFPIFTHHDFRHFFATTCIESGVDIPTVSRWLGHKDGGALAMRVYGHLCQDHSFAQIKRVTFDGQKPTSVLPLSPAIAKG